MQKTTKLLLITFALLFVLLLGLKVFTTVQYKKEKKEQVKSLPAFSFIEMNGRKYSRENIAHNKGIVIINYFDPDCDHCQFMTSQIIKNAIRFSTAQVIMVTNSDSAAVAHFINRYQLMRIKNIVMLRDPNSNFYKIWGSAVTPSFFIYKNGAIAKTIMGETKIENIIDVIK